MRPISPFSWQNRPKLRRASWRRPSPDELQQERRHQVRGDRRPGLPQHPPRRGRRRGVGPRRGHAGARLWTRRRARKARRSTWSSSRPTRPARCTSGTPGGPRSATRSAASSRPPAPRSPASTTPTTPAPSSNASAGRCYAAAKGRADAGGRLRRRVRQGDRRQDQGQEPDANEDLPRTGLPADAGRDADQPGAVQRPLRRLVLREEPARQRRGRARLDVLRKQRAHLREGRRHLAAHHRLHRRQGPGDHPQQRREDVLRRRLRVLHQQARARLRPLPLPARRRPPRLHRPAQGDRRLCR